MNYKYFYKKQKYIYIYGGSSLNTNKKRSTSITDITDECSNKMYEYENGERYKGEFKDDKKHGQGTFYWNNGNRYEGEFKDDKMDGKGTFYWNDGDRYEGEYKDDKMNGQGTYYFKSGNRYEGEWKDDKRNGQGEMYDNKNILRYKGKYKDDKMQGQGTLYLNYEIYNGKFKNDKMNGQGTMYFNNGDKYEGEFKDDKMNGQGTYYYNDGKIYIGKWKNNKRHDQGTLINKILKVRYDGKWKDDLRDGQGTLYLNDGVYNGEFKDDIREGQGTYYWNNGNRYEGKWKYDKMQGQGTFYFNNGEIYEGELKDNIREGQGTMYYNDGSRYNGKWKDDLREDQGTYFFRNGEIYIGKFKDNKKHGQGEIYYKDKKRYEGTFHENKKQEGKEIYFNENEEKISIDNYEDYKNTAISFLKKDLNTLQNFIKENQFIHSGTHLYELATQFLHDDTHKLSFDTKNYLINKDFLNIKDTDIDNILFIYYLLALFDKDCSLEQFIMKPNNQKLYDALNDKVIEKKEIENKIEQSCKNKKFIFILLTLKYTNGYAHQTSLFIDNQKGKKTIEYFDPNYVKGEVVYTEKDDKERIEGMITEYFVEPLGYKYIDLLDNESNNDFCTNSNDIIAFQELDKIGHDYEKIEQNIEKGGYCVNWVFFYLYYRLKKGEEEPDINQENVIDNFYKLLEEKMEQNKERDGQNTSFISIIRSISLFQKLFLIIFEHYSIIYPINEIEFSGEAADIFTKDFFLDNETNEMKI